MSTASYYTYYYGDKAVWNPETNQYDLKTSDDADVTSTSQWSSSTYTSLVGKYTCRSTTKTSCATVYYVAAGMSTYMYHFSLTNNTPIDDYNIKLATSITDNGDGTYTLVNPVEITRIDYYNSYSTYTNYYYCSDLTSETCSDMYYSTSTNKYQLTGINRGNVYKYGNSFEDSDGDGIYELKDTKEFWDWSINYNQINNNHYTCFNTSGECAELKYVYYTEKSFANYLILTNGTTSEEAIHEMLYADDVNTTDSTIKDYIDTWYEGAILDKTDANGVLYSEYLENAIFCASREITNLGAFNPNGGKTTSDTVLSFSGKNLECKYKTDRFTLKATMGGTEGYGNTALDYPIALLSSGEASLTNGQGYLITGQSYILLSPYDNFSNSGVALRINFYGINSYGTTITYGNSAIGVRPALSLSNSVEITSGDGSVTNPYQVKLSE